MSLRTLYQALLDSEPAHLRVIARQWDITLAGERRIDLAAELTDAMARAEAAERAWDALPSDSRAALEDLLRRDGAMPWPAFTRRWGQVRNIGPGRLEREEVWRDPISPTEDLWYRGFVHRTSTVGPTGVALEMAFVPEDLRLYLPTPPPLEIPAPEPASAPLQIRPGEDTLADDLVTLWSMLQNEVVRPTEEGIWPTRRREALLSRLHAPAVPRLALLEALAYEQSWISVDEREHLRPVPEPMLAWLRADRWTQWLALARAWQKSQHWNDLAAVPTLQSDAVLGWPNDPLVTRENFLELLALCTPGIWYAIDAFVTHAEEHMPDFLRPNGDYETWSLRDTLTSTPLRGFEAWEMVEGALLTFLVVGPLSWLGLVDLGQSNPHLPPDRFRLSEAGAAFLDLKEPPQLADPSPLKVHPGGLLIVPSARRYERFQLSRVATVTGSGIPHHFRLTPRSLARARRQRISLERIEEFLEEAAGEPLPSGLRKGLEHTYRAGERVKLARGWILRVQDPDLLTYEAVRDLIQEQLGSRVALIRESDRERLLEVLTSEGILPEIEEGVGP
ncbi:MAG: helicase-associated domain-containing protein [Anaerolineae bacterium]